MWNVFGVLQFCALPGKLIDDYVAFCVGPKEFPLCGVFYKFVVLIKKILLLCEIFNNLRIPKINKILL